MNEVIKLWSKRRSDYWTMAVKYLKLIGNSGFLFTLYLLFVFGSYYYGQFLQWLPDTFPAIVFFTLIFTWLMTRGRTRTFVKQGDLIFLTPLEGRLGSYIRASIRYSWLMETFWVSLTLLVLAPLFFDRVAPHGSSLLFILACMSLLKLWNLSAGFEEQRILDTMHYSFHTWMRAGLNAVAVYALFSQQSYLIIGSITLALTVFYFGYFQQLAKNYSLKWERLVDIENQTVMTFYRVANSFTDVPSLKSKVRSRSWLSPLYKLVPYSRKRVYHYMFARSFFRANDYFGIFIRLTFLGVLFLTIVELDWGRWLISVLFAYMTALQLETLKNHYDTSQMVDLYPVGDDVKLAGHKFWLLTAGVCQSLIFFVATVFSYGFAAGSVVLVLAVITYSYHLYVRLGKKYASSLAA
ncbi:ABC transporter permease [Salipaludibacillus agaradhaerens]|uniref:ABC transporter permease n=1 Tax=Salipaludibacillus agaradhaerens TaxID=76935 RepID=UPI0021516C55|nr:ABC transporter permease [Salipaludibacillus agaradhaerens]MCR6106163.1 ABC transporter permease [Salipaludibacillus agaradhaerens]MCR6118196.1 ABC transporter permease [Salipaludibacillus agaradhaerens]